MRVPDEWSDVWQVTGDPLLMPEDYLEPAEAEEVMNGKFVWQAAWTRAAYHAIGLALIAVLGAWASTNDVKIIIIAGATAALAALGFRGGVEGLIDSNRAKVNDVQRSDVGAFSVPIHDGQRTDGR
jgi:hypothetical protein